MSAHLLGEFLFRTLAEHDSDVSTGTFGRGVGVVEDQPNMLASSDI